MLQERDYSYYGTTTGMCRTCRKLIPSRIIIRNNSVYQEGLCSACGTSSAKIATDAGWYLKAVQNMAPSRRPKTFSRPVKKGCPFDCGLCAWHESACNLPVFSVTNACDLDCPICFTYNRPDKLYFMPPDEMRRMIKWLLDSEGQIDLINITGGEPTLHPRLLELLRICRDSRIGRITMNSNGLRLAKDEKLCAALKELGVYVVLSFNTFSPAVSKRMHGRDIVKNKLKALDNLRRYDIPVTIMNVMIPGVNHQEINEIIGLMGKYSNILSLTVQNMTYTGKGGSKFLPRAHLPVDAAAGIIELHTKGVIKKSDFVSLPSAHPLCYQVCYLLKAGDKYTPFRRFLSEEEMARLLGRHYFIHPEKDTEEIIRSAIDKLWAQGGQAKILKDLKNLVKQLYPTGSQPNVFSRQRRAESIIKTIYIHAHMDEDNFDLSRLIKCPDLVPDANRTFVPACAYNLFYRMKDKRFWLPRRRK
jgi:uncharacterized radical SAM superfamily Fe-S cluster-containing enzyme